jgi:hypothetical protein
MHHNQKMQLHNQAAASIERRANRFGNAVKAKQQRAESDKMLGKNEEMNKSGDKLGQPLFEKVPGKDMSPGMKSGMGTSRMGGKIRHPEIPHAFSAKETAQKELKRIKDAPKPNLPKSEDMDKALTASGSGMSSPGELEGGAALAKEDPEGHQFLGSQHPSQLKVGKKYGPKQMTYVRSTTGAHHFMHGDRAVQIKRTSPMLKNEKWLNRAEEAYNSWSKKEEFRNFMHKRLPNLTKTEVDALGRSLMLKKTLQAEKALGELVKSKK